MDRFIIGRVSGDHPIRGRGDTATRIYYQSPPPRTAITDDNDDSGKSARNLVYGDRGVTGVLRSTTYPRSTTLTLLSKEAANKPDVHYEPRHTPPDCFEAQDFALRKAEILLQETKRAKVTAKNAKLSKSPRRDSAVSEEDEPETGNAVTAVKEQEALATVDPQEQLALPTIEAVDSLTNTIPIITNSDPPIIITTTEPLPHGVNENRRSPKRVKLSPSPNLSSPANPAQVRRSKSRAESERRFAKPKTPPASVTITPAKRGESVASVRSTDSRSSRRSRGGLIKDDLSIDSKFGLDADELHEIEYLAKDGKWYEVTGGLGRPDWAIDARRKVRVVAPSSRRDTGAWRNH